MAGQSSRFANAGYELPKYMLPLHGNPLFDWTVLSFKAYFEREIFLFIARDDQQIRSFLQSRINLLGIKSAYCIYLQSPTRGQAETVFLGLSEFRDKYPSRELGPLTIFNIDTIRPNIQFPHYHGNSGWVETFRAAGNNWSFVLPDADNKDNIKECSEKRRISEFCCTGLYAFKNIEQFNWAYDFELKSPSSHELFIAPIYNHLISDGQQVKYYEVDSSEVFLSGIPSEYESLKEFNNFLL